MTTRRNKPYNRLKGVDAFIGEAAPSPSSSPLVALDRIVTSASQPRRYFDPEKLEQLTQSVKEHGILEPLLVRSLPDDKYELVAGERRYRAATAAGLKEVPVVIKELTDSEALQIALIENLQREDLNPVEETEGILQLLSLQLNSTPEEVRQLLYQMKNAIEKRNKDQTEFRDNVIPNSEIDSEKSIQSVFDQLSQNWYSFTCNRLPLLNLPEDILEALRSGQIEYTKAKAIASVKDETARASLLKDAIANSLSLSQIKERVSDVKPVKEKEELRSRFETTIKEANKSKQLWQDPKKRKKLESLLAQLEKLIGEDETAKSQGVARVVREESNSIVNKATLDPIFESPDSEPEVIEPEPKEIESDKKELTDQELGEVLKVSHIIIRDYRVNGKKPPAGLMRKLKDWEILGEGWVKNEPV
jgi:ParB family transcriptional regulator, chromosome partitioning protein